MSDTTVKPPTGALSSPKTSPHPIVYANAMTLEDKLHTIRHEMASHGQMFRSYATLLENPSLHIQRKKEIEILKKCGTHCLTVIQITLERLEKIK